MVDAAEHIGLVKKIANKYKNPVLEFDDLVGYGMIGLVRASQLFDSSKGKFSTYAGKWIDGCIKTALRDKTGELGTKEMITNKKGIRPISISEIKGKSNNEEIDFELKDTNDYFENALDAIFLDKLLDNLSEIDREIITAIYFEGYTQTQIAKIIGETRSYISYRLRRAQEKLKLIASEQLVC